MSVTDRKLELYMPKDARTRGIEVLAELYPDPTVREARTAELGEAGITALGNNVLRQDDYSRSQNELTSERAKATQLYDANQVWYTANAERLAELDAVKAELEALKAGGDPAKPTPAAGAKPALTEEAFNARIAQTERDAVAFISDMNKLAFQHFQQFGEILDTDALVADPRAPKIGVRAVYQDRYATQLKAKSDAAKLAAEEAIRADERTKVRAELVQHPYPVRGNDPSTLDGIQPPGTNPAVKSVDDMAAEYARLGASR